MIGTHNRSVVAVAVGLCVLITTLLILDRLENTSLGSRLASSVALYKSSTSTSASSSALVAHLPPPVQDYFQQAFSLEQPPPYDFPVLTERCARATWDDRKDVYLQCGNMFAGMTSIMSEMKTCFKMAVEAGTGLVLPRIPLRDSTKLQEFNIGHEEAYHPYDEWFEIDHLKRSLKKACPQMKVLHPDQIRDDTGEVKVSNMWSIDIMDAPGYHRYTSHFWTGRPYKTFFDDQLAKFRALPESVPGISVIKMPATFLLFRITEDPTNGDLLLWNELAMLMRFLEAPRKVVNHLMAQINRPFYGVHFRAENDTIWSSPENQLNHDLDGLDKAWKMYGNQSTPGANVTKPLVYLACGDEDQIKMFNDAAKARGWEVTDKWDLARDSADQEALDLINNLAFDFQGAVDLGLMLLSHFFIGISGSAFSTTISNTRDPTGRYRGSSLRDLRDGGARTHLFIDGNAEGYPCCL